MSSGREADDTLWYNERKYDRYWQHYARLQTWLLRHYHAAAWQTPYTDPRWNSLLSPYHSYGDWRRASAPPPQHSDNERFGSVRRAEHGRSQRSPRSHRHARRKQVTGTDMFSMLSAEVGIVIQKCNFVIRYSVTQKSNFVIRYSVTPLLRYKK